MKSFKQHIFEKLKVTPNSVTVHKEYINNTKEVTKYTAYKYHKYILDLDSMVLFMDYWYYFLESEDEELKEKLDIHWDDIYIDYDNQNVYVLDNSTGDEITSSPIENRRTFYNVYNRIIEYFEKKNS